MKNKYFCAFFKDGVFRLWGVTSIMGVMVVVILLRIMITDRTALKDIQRKQALISQIPSFQARLADTGSVSGFLLSGIIFRKEKPMAVINGQLVKVGDMVDGKRVVDITKHDATLCDSMMMGKCIQLSL
jgi:hypothetical protein